MEQLEPAQIMAPARCPAPAGEQREQLRAYLLGRDWWSPDDLPDPPILGRSRAPVMPLSRYRGADVAMDQLSVRAIAFPRRGAPAPVIDAAVMVQIIATSEIEEEF
jgi:hypothetical protein